jgi:hypothetical protein
VVYLLSFAQQGLALTIKGLATQPDPHKRPYRRTLKNYAFFNARPYRQTLKNFDYPKDM